MATESDAAVGTDSINYAVRLGYALALLLGVGGGYYLVLGILSILSPGANANGIAAFAQLVIAGTLFSGGTFVLLGSYVMDQ